MEEKQQEDIKKKEQAKLLKDYHLNSKDSRKKFSLGRVDRLLSFIFGGVKLADQKVKEKSEQEKLKSYNKILQIKEKEAQSKETEKSHQNLRNCVIFTGRALAEVFRDLTIQKSFMTLAYLSDMMVGSEIKPL